MASRALALLALLSAGCPPPREAGPVETLRAYVAAVRAGKLDRAYALMSAEYRRTHDRAAFERALGAPASVEPLGSARVELQAEAILPGGERLPLAREGSTWRIARDPLDFYGQRTPEEALRSFARAVEQHRYEVAIRFVPARYRGEVTVDALRARWEGERRAELTAQLQAVRDALARGEPIELGPEEEARLQVGERKQAKLIREGGLWKIQALE